MVTVGKKSDLEVWFSIFLNCNLNLNKNKISMGKICVSVTGMYTTVMKFHKIIIIYRPDKKC